MMPDSRGKLVRIRCAYQAPKTTMPPASVEAGGVFRSSQRALSLSVCLLGCLAAQIKTASKTVSQSASGF